MRGESHIQTSCFCGFRTSSALAKGFEIRSSDKDIIFHMESSSWSSEKGYVSRKSIKYLNIYGFLLLFGQLSINIIIQKKNCPLI